MSAPFAFLRLLAYGTPTHLDIALLAVGTITAVAAGVPFPILGILFGELVDDLNSASCSVSISSSPDFDAYNTAITSKVLIVVYLSIANLVLIFVYIQCWTLLGERLSQRIRLAYFSHVLRQSPSLAEALPAGEVAARLQSDVDAIRAGAGEKVGIYVASFSFFVTAFVVAFTRDARLAAMLLSLVPSFMAMTLVGGHYVEKFAGTVSDAGGKCAGILLEALQNIGVVRAFGMQTKLAGWFDRGANIAASEGKKKALATAIQAGVLYFVAYAANGLAFWQGSTVIAERVRRGVDDGPSVGMTYTVIFILVDGEFLLYSPEARNKYN